MTASVLEKGDIRFDLNPDDATFHISVAATRLHARCLAVVFAAGQRRALAVTPCRVLEDASATAEDAHGQGPRLLARLATNTPGLVLLLEIAAYDVHPFLALRVGLANLDRAGLHVHALAPLATSALEMGSGPLDSWVHGYHSWSFSGFIPHTLRQPRMITRFLTGPQSENPTTRYAREVGRTASEQVGALIDTPGQQALAAGFIGLEEMFGQVYMDGRPASKSLLLENTADGLPLPAGETLWGEWAILYRADLPHADPLGIYAEAAARLTPGRWPDPHPLPGWSSWYQFFDRVTADDMASNQAALRNLRSSLPLSLIQLDDGYQPAWGDWLAHNDRFPTGVENWADSVRADRFEPGLWISPFTIEPGARFWREHPEAVLRDLRGRPAHGGYLIKRWVRGLDPTHPVTQDHVRETIDTVVHRWGIRYLKLDYLYCGALPGVRHNRTRTRAQALRDGLRLIREVAGEEAVILACGCPPGPALGIADLMRVSADVAPYWYPQLFGLRSLFRADFTMPSARGSIAGTLNRSWTHRRWWWLDADNLLVREQQELNADEVQTLVTVMALTGSHLIVSDDLPHISAERLRWAASLLPLSSAEHPALPGIFAQTTPAALIAHRNGAVGPYVLVGLINWDDAPRTLSVGMEQIGLPGDEPLLVFDFWKRSVYVHQGQTLGTTPLPPHGAALLALRRIEPGPQYVGSDLHASMGGEVSAWQADSGGVQITVDLGRAAQGTIWLKLPATPATVECDGQPVLLRADVKPGLFALPVAVDGTAVISVAF